MCAQICTQPQCRVCRTPQPTVTVLASCRGPASKEGLIKGDGAADTSDTAALKVPASLAGKDKDGMKKGEAVNEGVEENGVGCDDRKRWRGIWPNTTYDYVQPQQLYYSS